MAVLYVAGVKRWFTDDTAMLPISLGTLVWLVAGIGVTVWQGITIWTWISAVGFISGAGGMFYLRRRAQRPGIRYE
jgi:hypothetical protein